MAFMLKKKRYKFQVDLCIEELIEVSYGKAIMFAKFRQLDGGAFTDISKRMSVDNHRVKFSANFMFPCKMNANISSGVLETCKCRISIRMEEKGGKHFRKIGFADINLAEYAGAGPSTQRYILHPYNQSHRLDNSILQIAINITLKEGDTIFQRPLTRLQPIVLPGEEAEPSLTQQQLEPKSSYVGLPPSDHAQLTESLVTRSSSPAMIQKKSSSYITKATADEAPSHTRHSSMNSQASLTSTGYVSSQHSQLTSSGGGTGLFLSLAEGHSRQSSSGESSTHGRNPSQGSCDTGFGGSLEKEKKRRKQQLDEGRIDAEDVIDELLEGVDLRRVEPDEAETSGLQLYVSKDGSVTFDKRQSTHKNFQPVVVKGPNTAH